MIDKDLELNIEGKVLTSTGIPLGEGPTAIFVPIGESIDQHIVLTGQSSVEFPKNAKKAHFIIEINGEEFILFETEFENEETRPFKLQLEPVKFTGSGEFRHFYFSPLNSKQSFSLTYKIIE